MRYLNLTLIVFLMAAGAMAKESLKGPSQLSGDAYEKVTQPAQTGSASKPKIPNLLQMQSGGNKEVSPATLTPEAVSQGFSLKSETPGFGISREAITSAPPTAAVEETNTVKTSKISFLMDTGVQYEDAGEYADAEKAYLRALEKDPGNTDIRFRLSVLYIQMKRYAEAVKILKALGSEFPDNAMVQNNLAWVYASGGEMKNGKLALRHAREALLSAPYAPSVWNTLAEAYYVSGDYDKALRSSDQALGLLKSQKQKPSDKVLTAFGEQHKKIERAVEAYKRMMKTDGSK